MNKKLKTAFTLIELLVVIAIIGILSGLIIVGMTSSVNSASIAKAQIFSSSLRDSLMMNIISEWKFDGSGVQDGGTATPSYIQDTWGSNSSGTINGSPLVRSGSNCMKGSCLDFVVPADFIYIGNSVTMNLNNGYTIEAWAKYRTITGNAKSIMVRRETDATGWFIFVYRNAGDASNFMYSYVQYTNTSNATSYVTPGTYLQTNQWYHLALSVDNTGVAKYYVNGTLKDTRNPTNFLKLGAVSATDTTSLSLAHWGSDGFDGLLDDTRIYSAAIPASLIKNQYFAGLNRLLSNSGISFDEYSNKINNII